MLIKEIFGSLSLIIALISFAPYIKDVLARKTTPHIYSWLVWSILQTTATVAILRQNTLWSALGVAALGLVSVIVFLLSFKYGTKNITAFDTVCLIGALIAILVWIFIHDVTLSIVLVTIIDFIAFLPTYRKGYEEPHSETIFLFICSAISNLFSLLSISHYSIESSLYVASLVLTNIIFVTIILSRRRFFDRNEHVWQLKHEGFAHVYTWNDKPNTNYPEHAHRGKVSFFVIQGSVTFSGDIRRTINAGERFDVPVGVKHSAIVGTDGCDWIVGEEIEGDS